MLAQLHEVLHALVRGAAGPDADAVDVAFERPDGDWVDRRTRPTVALFLFDVRENTDLRATAPQCAVDDRHAVKRVPPRRFDLSYLVSAVAADAADEHAVLWRVLVGLLRKPVLPNALLPPEVRAAGVPVTARLAPADQRPAPHDLWSALDAPPRPSLVYVVTVPVDLELAADPTPLVLTHTTRVRNRAEPAAAPEERTRIGGVVRGGAGAPLVGAAVGLERLGGLGVTTGEDGRFVLGNVLRGAPAPPEGTEVALRVTPPDGTASVVRVTVPSEQLDSFDVVAD